MGDVGRNVPGRGPSKAKTQAWAKSRARSIDQWSVRLQLRERGGMGEDAFREAGGGRIREGL